MRTTLQIDDDVMQAARCLARHAGKPVGRIISDLARQGLQPTYHESLRDGFPVFDVAQDVPPVSEDTVSAALDDDL